MIEIPEHIKIAMENHFLHQESPEDRALLQEWRSLHPDHEEEYDLLLQIWSASGDVLAQPSFDTAKAWQSLDNRIGPATAQIGPAAPQTQIIDHPKNHITFRPYNKTTPSVPRLPLKVKAMMAAAFIGIAVLAASLLYRSRTGKQDTTNPIAQQSVFAATGNKYLTLPDGSTVLLRKGATLTYPKDFSNAERRVSLSGEAFFDIRQEKDHPFRINTNRSLIEVLGTSFLVDATKRSDRVVVATGKILFTDKTETRLHCILASRQEAVLLEQRFEQRTVAGANYLSWQTGDLQFDETPLDQVARDLGYHYGVTVRLADTLAPKADLHKVTGKFKNQPLEQPLEEITGLTGLHYRREGDTITLY